MKKFKEFWKKFNAEWDLKAILLFFIPFFFVLSVFLWAFLAEGELRSGEKKFVLFDGTRPIDLYAGNKAISKRNHTNPPVITVFSVAPNTIDLDTRPSGTITFTLAVTGIAGGVTNAQIVRLPHGANIGTTFTAAAGSNISTDLPNVVQPQSTTTYRLFASNSGGHSHRDTTVTVTKNPTITNCRRVGYIDSTKTYFFGWTLTGLPQPTVTYSFSGGQSGTASASHLSQGSNPYTWYTSAGSPVNYGLRITFANSNAQSLTLTATNASGSSTCTISNINN